MVAKCQINLVPNPSFETYIACPWGLGEINKASPWFQPSARPISTDFFHPCSSYQADVPNNQCGYQTPRTGLGYAGLIVYSRINGPLPTDPKLYREYLEVELTDTLIQGKIYCVEFFISLSNNFNIVTDRIGAYFSTDSILSSDYANLPYIPHVENALGNLLVDTLGWMKISGVFTATGGEQYMTIGNFKDDLNTFVDTLSTMSSFCYFYIDDISVKEMLPVTAEAGTNTNICLADELILGAPPVSPYFKYTWSPSIGLNNSNIAQPLAQPIVTTTYYLTVTDTAVSCSIPSMDSVIITVLPYITPSAYAGSSATICAGDTINIGSAATAGYSYTWFPQISINDGYASSAFVFPTQTTLYTLTVSDTASNYLCKTSGNDNVLIIIEECPPEIPNVFTPNNDGINDVFEIENLSEGSSIRIYNRWGILVYEQIATMPKSEFNWDGRSNSGEAMSEGTYFYIIELPNANVYKGSLQLIKSGKLVIIK
jgi:gliding motility-associated-like protein